MFVQARFIGTIRTCLVLRCVVVHNQRSQPKATHNAKSATSIYREFAVVSALRAFSMVNTMRDSIGHIQKRDRRAR